MGIEKVGGTGKGGFEFGIVGLVEVVAIKLNPFDLKAVRVLCCCCERSSYSFDLMVEAEVEGATLINFDPRNSDSEKTEI